MFYAEKNKGAFYNNQRIRVSKKNSLEECLFAIGKMKKEPDLAYRRTGCASLDIAYVASGRLDGYVQDNAQLWDIAAGIIILKEAGGFIDFFEPDNEVPLKRNILASNANIHNELSDLIIKKNIE